MNTETPVLLPRATAALPFHLPRTAYVSGALALVALTMFGIRYGVTQSLDFKPSLVGKPVTGTQT